MGKGTITLLFLFALISIAMGGTITWISSRSGNFSDPNNWNGGVVPGAGSEAIISGNGVSNTFVAITGSISPRSLQLSGVTLTVQSGVTATIGANLNISGTVNLRVESTGNLAVSENLRLLGNSNLGLTINGAASGGLQVDGSGATVTGNTATGAYVVNAGARNVFVRSSFTFPKQGMILNAAATATFNTLSNAGVVLTFDYTPVISTTWTLDNSVAGSVDLAFNQGVTFNAGASFAYSATGVPNNRVTLSRVVTTNAATTLPFTNIRLLDPQFATNTFNGAATLTLQGLATLSVDLIIGNGAVNIVNENTVASSQQVSIAQAVEIRNPNFNFVGPKTFSGSTVTWTGARTINQMWTINNVFIYTSPLTAASSAIINGTGRMEITSSYNTQSSQPFDLLLRLRCPQGTFSFAGSTFRLGSGLEMNACTVSSATSLTVRGSVTTRTGNSSLPMFNYDMGVTFASDSVTNPLRSISIPNTAIGGTNFNWVINNVVLITTGDFSIASNNDMTSSGAARWYLRNSGTLSIATGSTLASAIDLLVEGTRTFTAPSGFRMFNELTLREATVTSTADIRYLNSNLYVTSGMSSITSNLFNLENTLNVRLQTNVATNPPIGWLSFNTVERTFQASITARTNTYVNLPQSYVTNSTITFTSTENRASFLMAGGQRARVVAGLTLNGNTTLQGAYQFVGSGSVTISGNNENLNLFGNLNAPNPATQVPVLITVTNVNLFADVQMGSLVDFRAPVLNDDDSNNVVPTRTLTLLSAGTSPRDLRTLTLNANLVVQGNVRFPAAASFSNDDSTLTIQGSVLTFDGAVTFNSILALTSNAVTFNGVQDATINSETFNVPGTITLVDPVDINFQNRVVASFQAGNAINGDAALRLNSATFIAQGGVVTLSGETITTGSASFNGAGFILNPANQDLSLGSIQANTMVTYNGPTVSPVSNPTTVQQNVVFGASPNVTFEANSVLFTGDRTITNTFVADGVTLTFRDYLTLNGDLGALNGGSFEFQTALANNADKTIDAPVTFSSNTGQIVSVATQNTITLTGATVTVNTVVQAAGGNIVSSRAGQVLSGNANGVIPAEWTWNTPIEFGRLNITGQRTISRVHTLNPTGSTYTRFVGGVVLANGGGFVANSVKRLGVEVSWTTNQAVVLGTNVFLEVSGDSFTFDGPQRLTTNGTFQCRSAVTFTSVVTFGFVNPSSGNTINFDGCSWTGSSALPLWRNSLQQVSGNTVLNVPINFMLANATVNVLRTSGTLLFNGNIELRGLGFSLTNAFLQLGSITFTSFQNATLTGINSDGILTFASTAPVEPIVSFSSAGLDFTINLDGPVRLPNVVLSNGAAIEGTQRAAFLNGVVVNGNIIRVTAPTQIYHDTTVTRFTFTASSASSQLVLNSPSLFNPIGLGAPDLRLSGAGTIRLTLDGTVRDFVLDGNGFFRLSGGTFNGRNWMINNNGTLWIDGATATLQNLEFTANFPSNVASNFQFTINSASTTPVTVTGNAIYQGVAVVVVDNFMWNGASTPVINAATSANSNFLLLRGPPSFNYVVTKSMASDVSFQRTANPTNGPAPTQTGGNTPAVNSAVSKSIAFSAIFLSLAIYLIFN